MMTKPSRVMLYLEETVKNWEKLGHPAIMERFVLRNGKMYEMVAPPIKLGTPHECYANATRFVQMNSQTRYSYVEGFMLRDKLPIAIQHGWVRRNDGDNWMRGFDPTLADYNDSDYMGVEFDHETLREQLARNKVYGLLDHGHGINTDLIFRLDPELKPIVEKVIANRRQFA